MSQPYVGEIRQFAGNFAPAGWMLCQGQTLPISEYETLFTLIGTTYGGDGQETFSLPNLASRVPIHMGTGAGSSYVLGQASGTETVTLTIQQVPQHTHAPVAGTGGADTPVGNYWGNSANGKPYAVPAAAAAMKPGNISIIGGSQPHDNIIPVLAMNYIISLFGIYPTQGGGGGTDNFMAQINIFSFNFAPTGWALCNGQFLPINQNQALFSLLGTTYGGNGQTNFALPNLQGRVPIHLGNGYVQGQSAGETSHTLLLTEMPQHTHQVMASALAPDASTPAGNTWASSTGFSPYTSPGGSSSPMDGSSISSMGGSQAHNNMSPYLTLNFCVAIVGIFPSRN